jgi:hypothetical protein
MDFSIDALANWANIIAALLAVLAIIVGIWLSRRSTQKKSLSCSIDPLLSPIEIKTGDTLKGDIEVRYKGHAIDNLFVMRVRIKNTGTLPIRKSEVVEPLTFVFGPDSELLRLPLDVDRKPDNLKLRWTFGKVKTSRPDSAVLDFDLLNQGEEFTIEFVFTGKYAIPKIMARIEGLSEIELLDPEETHLQEEAHKAWKTIWGVLALGVVLAIMMGLQALYSSKGDFPIYFFSLQYILMAVVMTYEAWKILKFVWYRVQKRKPNVL